MADIINFDTKDAIKEPVSMPLIKEILIELLKESPSIQDLMILVKDKDGNKTMLHTGIDLETKSVFVQLLQHDIFNDLASTEELILNPDL